MAKPGKRAANELIGTAVRAAVSLALISSALAQTPSPLARFDITGYAVEGAPLLRSEDFSRVVAPLMGRQKTSADVLNAQQMLQQAYQNLGHCAVQVVASPAEPRDGVVSFKILQSRSPAGGDCLPMVALGAARELPLPVVPAGVAAKSNMTKTAASDVTASSASRMEGAHAPPGEFLHRSSLSTQMDAAQSAAVPATAALNAPRSPPLPRAAVAGSEALQPPQRVAQAPAATVDSTTPAAPVEAAPTLKFDIDRYQVEGNTLLKPEAIAKVLRPYAGKQKDFADVQRALEALQIAYQKAGWGTVQVTLPEQELERGEVRFEVIETRVGKIEVQAGQYFNEANIRGSLPSLQVGRTPNSQAVARGLKIANESPSKQTQVSLKSGSKDGEVDADVKVVDDNPRKYSVSLDNTGTSQTGVYRLGFGFQHSNLWNRDHQLTLQYITSPENVNKVTVLGAGYRIPLYESGNSIDLVLGYSDVDSGTVQQLFTVSGSGLIALARYNYNLNRIEDYEHKVTLGLDYKAFQNQVTIGGTGLVPDITLHPVSVAYSGELRREQSALNFYAALSYNAFPGGNDAAQSDFTASRRSASAEYTIWRYGVNYQRLLPYDWTVRLAANGQTTRNALVAGEQFGVGGANSVRGFNERAYSNDKGHQATVEIYTPDIARKFGLDGARLKVLAFYDTGSLSRNFLQPGEPTGLGVDSIGLGLRLTIREKFDLRVDYAQVKHDGGTDSGLPNGRRNSNTVHAGAIFVY